MCANFEPITKAQASLFTNQQLSFDFKTDIYPGYDCPLLFANVGDSAEWRSVKFGMVPKWAKDLDICRFTYNARTETVGDKPSFENAWHHSQFALIPVQTIFEPKYPYANEQGYGKSQRWGIYREDGQPFTVAAIYEVARIQGEIIRSMSMLTINADQHPLMSQFHRPDDEKRSIVVIEPEYQMDWLTATPENAFKLLQPMGEGFRAREMPRAKRAYYGANIVGDTMEDANPASQGALF